MGEIFGTNDVQNDGVNGGGHFAFEKKENSDNNEIQFKVNTGIIRNTDGSIIGIENKGKVVSLKGTIEVEANYGEIQSERGKVKVENNYSFILVGGDLEIANNKGTVLKIGDGRLNIEGIPVKINGGQVKINNEALENFGDNLQKLVYNGQLFYKNENRLYVFSLSK